MSLTFDSWLMLYVFLGVNALSCIIGVSVGLALRRRETADQERLIASQRTLIAKYEDHQRSQDALIAKYAARVAAQDMEIIDRRATTIH